MHEGSGRVVEPKDRELMITAQEADFEFARGEGSRGLGESAISFLRAPMVQSEMRSFRVEPMEVVFQILLDPVHRLEEEHAAPVLLLHRSPETVDLGEVPISQGGISSSNPSSIEESAKASGPELSATVGDRPLRPTAAIHRSLKQPRCACSARVLRPDADRQHASAEDIDHGTDRDGPEESPDLSEVEDIDLTGTQSLDRLRSSAGGPSGLPGRRTPKDPLQGSSRGLHSQPG